MPYKPEKHAGAWFLSTPIGDWFTDIFEDVLCGSFDTILGDPFKFLAGLILFIPVVVIHVGWNVYYALVSSDN